MRWHAAAQLQLQLQPIQAQATLRRRILRTFVGRGLLERLLRYCARPPFVMDRLRKEGAALG